MQPCVTGWRKVGVNAVKATIGASVGVLLSTKEESYG